MDKGRVICLLGANGAGKSTTLRAISSLVSLTSGTIYLGGQRIDGLPPHHVVKRGVIHVPEQKRLLCEMVSLRILKWGLTYKRIGKK